MCTVNKCRVIGLMILMSQATTASAAIRYVDAIKGTSGTGTSWSTAYGELQDALSAAQAGDEIRVAAGVYRPDYLASSHTHNGNRAATFTIKSGVILLGGFPRGGGDPSVRDPAANETILSGDLLKNDNPVLNAADMPADATRAENSYHVVTVVSANASTRLDGFVISGGHMKSTVSPQSEYGAGMYTFESAITLSRCTFRYNHAGGWGGALLVERGTGLIADCTFYRNSSRNGGALNIGSWNSGTQRVSDCTFRENAAVNGGAAYLYNPARMENCAFAANTATDVGGGAVISSGALLNSVFAGNTCPAGYGGGLFAAGNQCVVQGNVLLSNSAKYGGGASMRADSAVTNCALSGNTAEEGGAFHVRGACTIANCTAFENTATVAGGGVLCFETGSSTLRNSILWNNHAPQGPQIALADSITTPTGMTVSYSCVQGGEADVHVGTICALDWSAGNLTTDPAFADPDGADDLPGTIDDNFFVTAGSPCLDAGSNDLLPLDAADLDGDADKAEPIPQDAAGHVRRADDLSAADTGTGTPPFVDLGAYEGIGQSIIINPPSPLDLPEGQQRILVIRLAVRPGATVTVGASVESGDSDLHVASGSSLAFDSTNFDTPQQIILEASQDADFLNGSAVLLVDSPGLPPVRIQLHEVEDEPVPIAIHVDAAATGARSGLSWTDAFTELQDAISAMNSRPGSSEIRMARGTYLPDYDPATGTHTRDRVARFRLPSGVTLRGGFAGVAGPDPDACAPALYETILSGDLLGDDGPGFTNRFENSICVLLLENVASSTIVQDLTVRSGYSWGGQGTAIAVVNGSPRIRECRITDNWCAAGALYIAGSALVTDCVFDANRAYYRYATVNGDLWVGQGAAIRVNSGSPVISRCTFRGNVSDTHGGAFYCSAGASTLVNCVFTENACHAYPSYYDYEGGGAINNNAATLTVINCTLLNNRCLGDGGAAYAHGGMLRLYGCLIAGNLAGSSSTYTSARAGGVYGDNTLQIVNSTLADNRCTSSTSQAIYSYYAPTVSNSIVWGNTLTPPSSQSSLVYVGSSSGGNPIVKYSCVEKWSGSWGGTGNTGLNPLFAGLGAWNTLGTSDPTDDTWTPGDYRLRAGSPGIDAGSNALVPTDSADLDADGKLTEPQPWDLTGGPRFTDDPAAADTGAGISPLVDMGAYELVIIPGDLDRDWDVDYEDLRLFMACVSGPAVLRTIDCAPVDFDNDNDVDQSDLGVFQRCYRGANIPGNPNCAN